MGFARQAYSPLVARPDRAAYRHSRLKLEVTLDPILLPVGFQSEWNGWKHLIAAKVELQAEFVKAGQV